MKTFLAAVSLSLFAFPFAVKSEAIPQQQQSASARLTGRVTDPAGAAVGDVDIVAQSAIGSGGQRTYETHSAADGTYSLSLPAGRYTLLLVGKAFLKGKASVTVGDGEARTLDIRLSIQPTSSSVVVTAQIVPTAEDKTSAPAEVITRDEIEQRQQPSLTELLQFSTGIATDRTGPFGGSASIFLNGGNSNFTKVLVDGTPINSPGAGVDFSSLTTDNLERVEIVRGAESAVYGTDAVSGVIQLFTQRGETHVPALSVYSEGGSYGSGLGGANLSGALGKFDYSGGASYFQTEGQGPNDYFVNRTLSGNFGYAFSANNQIRVTLRNNTSDSGVPGPTLESGVTPDLYQGYNQKIFSANARWDFTTGSHWKHELMGTESYTRQHSFANQGDTFPYDSLLKFNRAGFVAQSTYVAKSFLFTAGYQYEVENGFIEFTNPGHLRRNNQAGFLDARYTAIRRLTLDVGVRADANDYFGTRVTPRVGGTYALHYGKGFFGDTRYRAFYGQGIKEPRFDQNFSNDPCFPGNPGLKPEASKTWSTGFEQKLADDRWKLSADYFYSRFYDIVSFGFCNGTNCAVIPACPFGNGQYFNTDLAIARGVNIASEFRVRSWLFVKGNYSYDNSRVVQSPNAGDASELPGNHLLRRPVNSGSLGLNVAYARFNWNFIGYFTGVRVDSEFIGAATTQYNPRYARFDMAFSYHLMRGLFATSRVTNLFDKHYQDALGYPALGRDYRFGLRYTFAGHN